jgi:hypothetical protein
MATQDPSRLARWTGLTLTALAAAPFVMSAAMKFFPNPQVTDGMAHLGWPLPALLTLAILEAGSVLLYLIPRVAMLGAVVLTGYLGGAIATHLRIGEPVYLHVALGLFIWGGLYLREPRLRALLPLRSS